MRCRSISAVAALLALLVSPSSHALTLGQQTVAGFPILPGLPERGALYKHTDGKFYGTTAKGGAYNKGTIYSVTPSGQMQWISLSGIGGSAPGEYPSGALTPTPDGWFWGTTQLGGTSYNFGTIFRVKPQTGEHQVMVVMGKPPLTGRRPSGRLVADGNGWLWGTATEGGSKSLGVLFKIHPLTGEYVEVKTFNNNSTLGDTVKGSGPGELYYDGSTYIWGVTSSGGAGSNGTVFRINPTTNDFTTVGQFSGFNVVAGAVFGTSPTGALTPDGHGFLWGTTHTAGSTSSRYGTIFKVNLNTGETTHVMEFTGAAPTRGANPRGSLALDSDGFMWGVTNLGGSSILDKGTIFKFDPTAVSPSIITVKEIGTLTGANAMSYPVNPLINDGNGFMWGMCTPGTQGIWNLYKVEIATGNVTSITSGTEAGIAAKGSGTKSALTGQAGSDWLYGTAAAGGALGYGTVYRYNVVTGKMQTLVDFTFTSGAALGGNPGTSRLLFHTDGTIWGTTANGGTYSGGSFGTVFKYDPVTHVFSNIINFSGGNTPNIGAGPRGQLVTGKDGFIWGTTELGNNGTLYKIDPTTGQMTMVRQFAGGNSANGSQPLGGLTADANGILWGTTSRGGGLVGSSGSIGAGTIFKVDPMTNTFTTVLKFTGDISGGANPGKAPTGDLVYFEGKLWGRTSTNYFSFDPVSAVLTPIAFADISTLPDEVTNAALYRHSDGLLYGTTLNSGADADGKPAGGGAIYRLVPGYPNVSTAAPTTVSSDAFPASVTPPSPPFENGMGGVDFNGSSGSYWIEWGSTTALGRSTSPAASAGSGGQAATTIFTNLAPLATYYFRVVANSPLGMVRGNLQSFQTRPYGNVTGPEIFVESPIGNPLTSGATEANFGEVKVGETRQKEVVIRNLGNSGGALTGLSAAISGANAGKFAITTALGATTLAQVNGAGQMSSTSLVITYTPDASSVAGDSATLTITSNDSDEANFVVPLAGTGTLAGDIAIEQPADSPVAKDGTTLIDFGAQNVGVSTAKTFRLRNAGNATLANISATITGNDPTEFHINAQPAGSLAAGATSDFDITFTPAGGGAKNATLVFTSNDPDEGSVEINLTGIGNGAPEIAIEQPAGTNLISGVSGVNFGGVLVGSSAARTFVIRNTGTVALTGVSASIPGQPQYQITRNPVATVPAGGATTFEITYSPAAPLPAFSSVHISSNDADESDFSIALSGSGVNAAVIGITEGAANLANGSVSARSFGTVATGSATTKTFVIHNSGNTALTNISASMAGGSAGSYSVTTAPLASIAPGASTSVVVTFAPSSQSVQTGTLQILSSDASASPFTVALTGTCLNTVEIAVEENGVNLTDGGVLNFGSAAAGSVVTKTFVIRNSGNSNLTGVAASFAAGAGAGFAILTQPAGTVAPNGSTTLVVTFTAPASGSQSAALKIASNDADENPFDISLSASGSAAAAPVFTAHPGALLLPLGTAAGFSPTVVSTPGTTYQWKKNGAAIATAKSLALNIATTKAADVGAYVLAATNATGTTNSNSGYLGLVTPVKAGASLLLKEGAASVISLSCTAAIPTGTTATGVSLSYQWTHDGAPMSDSGTRIKGARDKALKITGLTGADSGVYTCVVTMQTPAGNPTCSNGNTTVTVQEKPVFAAITLPDTVVSQTVNRSIAATGSPKYSATGLPPGVKLDANTGVLSGKPTAVKSGTPNYYVVKFTATNTAGSDTETVNWTITALDPSFVGNFQGIVPRHNLTNFDLGGFVQITTASTGAVSGSITLAGQKYTVAGALDAGAGDAEGHLTVKRTPAALGNLNFDFIIEKGRNLLNGFISDHQFMSYANEQSLGDGSPGSNEGTGTAATFNGPRGLVLLEEGGIVADTGNHTLRLVEEDGQTSLLAGGVGAQDYVDGDASTARFNAPEGLAMDASGAIYIADVGNHRIRKIVDGSPPQVSTFAGTGAIGSADGPKAAATFSAPCALTFDTAGNLYVVDRGNHNIRKITPAGVVSTLAGRAGSAGFKDAAGTAALFNNPNGITFDATLKALFVTDTGNHVIRKITPTGTVSTYSGAPMVEGENNGVSTARWFSPLGITSDGHGTLYVTDGAIFQITPGAIVGAVTAYVDDSGFSDRPAAISRDPEGTLVVADPALHGIISHEPQGYSDEAFFIVRRTTWTTSNPMPAGYAGAYTAAISPEAAGQDEVPQGSGFATLTVKSTGAATWAGKTADGAAITFNTTVGPEGEVPMHTMQYKNTGSIQGLITIDGTTGDLNEETDITFDWHKVPQTAATVDRIYKTGFFKAGQNLVGGKFAPANHVFSFLDLTPGSTAANAQAGFSYGGLSAPFSQLFDVKAPSTVTFPSNASGVKITFTPATGLFTGSFSQGTPARKADIAGVLVRTANGSVKQGFGYFLLPQVPGPSQTAANAPILSGKVSLQKAP